MTFRNHCLRVEEGRGARDKLAQGHILSQSENLEDCT